MNGLRSAIQTNLALGATPSEEVKSPTRTRDELPPTLAALQWVFTTPEVSAEVCNLLNYDRLHDVANYDSLVRQLLGRKRRKRRKRVSVTQSAVEVFLTELHFERDSSS